MNIKPLSAYNLFFQYNRIKLLAPQNIDPDNLEKPYSAPHLGPENVEDNFPLQSTSQQEIRMHRKRIIESTIDNSPFNDPSTKANHGSMTFLEMSNYMSKKWKNADETTKSIFRQISNERKAKRQKLQFDSYKKSAERFSLTAKSAALAKVTQLSKNNLADKHSTGSPTDSIAPVSRYEVIKTNASMRKSGITRNDPLPDVRNSGSFPSPMTREACDHQNDNDKMMVRSHFWPNLPFCYEIRNSKKPFPAYGSSSSNTISLIDEEPVPLYGNTEQLMSNEDLQGWLSKLDWTQI
ncbi:hypothetical protein ACHAXS_010113 [Conticribra weissflogii]